MSAEEKMASRQWVYGDGFQSASCVDQIQEPQRSDPLEALEQIVETQVWVQEIYYCDGLRSALHQCGFVPSLKQGAWTKWMERKVWVQEIWYYCDGLRSAVLSLHQCGFVPLTQGAWTKWTEVCLEEAHEWTRPKDHSP